MGQIKLEVVLNFADSSLCPFLESHSNLYSPSVPTAKPCELLLLEKVKINLVPSVLQTFCGRTRLLLRVLLHPPTHILEVKS